MARKAAPVEVNSFIGGLVTDAGPLTFPENGSLDEDNMVLNANGRRDRRLGMDFEDSASTITTSISYSATNTYGHTSYRWENAGASPSINLLAVQFGNEVKVFNLNNNVVSSEVIGTVSFDVDTIANNYNYATVDGVMVITTGQKEVTLVEYDPATNTISSSTDIIRIRDLFGVEAVVDGEDLKVGNNITTRPASINDEHKYNLRNQSWADPRRSGNTETSQDPIIYFQSINGNYPSNADAVTKSLYADANDTDNRTIERFFAEDLSVNRLGSSYAPIGHYIIDAMDRGASRLTAYQKTIDDNASITLLDITTLVADRTEGGPSVVAQFAGRAWYAGFDGALISGDNRSPRLSSYVMFSRKMNDITDLTRCYQDGDPTATDEPELIDTDGGFLRIDGAYGIKKLVNLGSALFVMALNGVWFIEGSEDAGFTATNPRVVKVSDRGIVGSETVVEVEGSSLVYWGEDGIYNVSKNQLGDWVAESISNNVIDELYGGISTVDLTKAQGYYDGFDKKVRWIYQNTISSASNVRELVLDRPLGAFYTNTIFPPTGVTLPKVVGIFAGKPFKINDVAETVVIGSDVVQIDAEDVIITAPSTASSTREIQYIAVSNVDTVIKYSFCLYKDLDFLDFKSVDNVGTDAAAYMVTGYLSGGNFQNLKQILYMTVYSQKTEDGYTINGDGDFTALNQSSIQVQTQWEWTNSSNSNRWGRVFEAYRHKRLYFPEDVNDAFNDGNAVVITKNKLRGKGRVLSIKFSTSPGKNFRLWGWSLVVMVNERA